MLVRLLPEQVSARWGFFAPLIAQSLPPTVAYSVTGMSNILRAILMDELIGWGLYDKDDNLIFVVFGVDVRDNITLQKNFLVYAFTAIQHVTKSQFVYALENLREYARSQGCVSIMAYTENEKITNFLSQIGADISYQFINIEV